MLDAPAIPPGFLTPWIGGPPHTLVLLRGGRNSRAFKVTTPDGQAALLKAYASHPEDPRDRLGTEFRSLQFLWERGVRRIPRPLAMDAAAGLGAYEFIHGDAVPDPSLEDIRAAARFLLELQPLAREADALPAASEASFSLDDTLMGIEARFRRFDGVENTLLSDFIEGELRPAWRAIRTRALARCEAPSRELAPDQRTLSPSDFGFHNALRRNGELVFLDFEYFGWDDPAKMLVDFLLHPGMELAFEHRRLFAELLIQGLPLDSLRKRAQLVLPVFGIKWCLILLNEFLPGPLDRRRFASPRGPSTQELQGRQLLKARTMLQYLENGEDPLAYHP
jgi:hypothetical protein